MNRISFSRRTASRRAAQALLLSSTLYLAALQASAATTKAKTPTKPKTPAKFKPKTTPPVPKPKLIREVMGTEQLVGYEGAFGQTFTIGKETAVNVTLKKAEYSTGRINIGQYSHFADGDQKMLVLHFTVQNPLKSPFNFSSTYLIIKAVDASGVTRTALNYMGREVTHESVNYALQPGQKVDVYSAVPVAAYGEVPKLIIQNYYDREAPIVRYDLRGKVTKLLAPVADPADAKGATARKVVPAKIGVYYPVADYFDVRIDGINYSTGPIAQREPEKGNQYIIATATVKNSSPRSVRVGQSFFRADLKDADGEKTNYNTSLLKASRDEEADAELLPGEEAHVRFYWQVPEGVKAKTVLLQYGYNRESRTYAVDVEGTQ